MNPLERSGNDLSIVEVLSWLRSFCEVMKADFLNGLFFLTYKTFSFSSYSPISSSFFMVSSSIFFIRCSHMKVIDQ